MKALLIVGHANSDYALIEKVLFQQGMEQAKPSRREALTASEIGKKLLKTQEIEFSNLTCFDQLEAGEVWNELALDLLLANIEQPFWGWADPQTILLLNYWRKVEPQLKFLLLYDKPEMVFNQLFTGKQISKEELEQAVNYWNDFYEEILNFYHRNQSNCLLVHIGSIRENSAILGQAVAEFMPYKQEATDLPVDIDFSVNESSQLLMAHLLKEKEYSSLHTSYEALQAVADLPLSVEETPAIEQSILVWNSDQQSSGKHKEQNLPQQDQAVTELEQENELLLLQLHQVQEELEHYFLENQKLSNGDAMAVNASSSSYSSSSASSFHYGAADRIKQQLSYRLGATMIQQSRTVRGGLMMPWALLKENKAFRKDFKARKHEKLPPITEYQDAYEAERVKQHLSYRLGHALVKNINSVMGWIKLPWLLRREVLDFQKRRGY